MRKLIHRSQDGNAALAVLVVGSAVLGLYLSNSQSLVNQRLKAAKIVNQNIQNSEAGLTALSITKQMLWRDVNDNTSRLSLGFSNQLNPSVASGGLQLIFLETTIPSTMKLANGIFSVATPDPVKMSNEDMNNIFSNKILTTIKTTDVKVNAYSWEPFPARGYGVKTVYLQAAPDGSNSVTKARMEVPVPGATCAITVKKFWGPSHQFGRHTGIGRKNKSQPLVHRRGAQGVPIL